MKAKTIAMFECIPRQERVDESEILFQFLEATDDNAYKATIIHKSEFLKELVTTEVARATHVHLSGHGVDDEFYLPNGKVRASEFPEGCFTGKVVTLSSCCSDTRDSPSRSSTGPAQRW
ncbi:MAG: hypothetical protein H0V89_00410 [Deltaproteobacteria bacterium]|nr:hypothetical protein [Deltaproteobacteria bacterium]